MSAPLALVPRSNALATRKGYQRRRAGAWSAIAAAGAAACWVWPIQGIGVAVTAIALWFVFGEFHRDQARRAGLALSQADAAAARGNLALAHELYYRLAQCPAPAVAVRARSSLAWTVMREGQFAYAIELLEDNDARNLGALCSARHHATIAFNLALVYALSGDVASAGRWLAEAASRARDAADERTSHVAAFARAVISCRTGAFAEVERLVDDAHGGAVAVPMSLRVLRAFAIAELGPREAGRAYAALDGVRAEVPGELAFLGEEWPEMATFLRSHQL
jgi:tetratricopeptide (TPR) repeat protein